MKKILSTVAALGLVAGMATAAQALEFKVSGYYFVEGTHMSSADGSGVVTTVDSDNVLGVDTGVNASLLSSGTTMDDEAASDSYWNHEFVIKPVMKVNDKIVMKSKIYLAMDKFGDDASNTAWDQSGNEITVHHLFMEYTSPIGMFRVGRTSAGLWQGDFLSSDLNGNRIMYYPNFMPENWGSVVFLQKKAEGDSAAADVSDQDHDYYEAGVWYKTKDLVAALAVGLTDDDSVESKNTQKTTIKGYYNQNFGSVYSEVEFALNTGDVEYEAAAATDDTDIDNFALMADVGMKMDKLDVGMMFIYASGDDDTSDNDSENAGALGEQFQPYTILTGRHTGMLSQDFNGTNADMTFHGIMSLGVHADFAVNDKLSLNTAIVYAMSDTDEWTIAPGVTMDIDDEYGWEIDLGMSYALMDNLTYEVNFGYLMAGDFFEGYEIASGVGPFGEAEDVMVLNHRLTMEF